MEKLEISQMTHSSDTPSVALRYATRRRCRYARSGNRMFICAIPKPSPPPRHRPSSRHGIIFPPAQPHQQHWHRKVQAPTRRRVVRLAQRLREPKNIWVLITASFLGAVAS